MRDPFLSVVGASVAQVVAGELARHDPLLDLLGRGGQSGPGQGGAGDAQILVVDALPGGLVYHAGDGQAQAALNCVDGGGGLGAENAVNGQHGHGGGELADDGDKVLEGGHGHTCAALPEGDAGGGALNLGEGLALTDQLGQLSDRSVEGYQLIPGALAHNAVGGEVENPLELLYRLLGLGAEHAVHRADAGDGGVVAGDAVEHGLEHGDIAAGGAGLQGVAGVGVFNVADRGIGYQLNIVSIIVAQDIHGAHALTGQGLAAPLGQSVTGDGGAVAELGGQGLHKALPADVGGEQLIHQIIYIFKGAPPLDEFLVVHGGGGDVEVVAPAGVVLGVHPIQGEGDLGQDVGPQGGLRPGGVNLAGGHVFDVIGEGDGDVFRPLVGRSSVDGDGLGYVGRD